MCHDFFPVTRKFTVQSSWSRRGDTQASSNPPSTEDGVHGDTESHGALVGLFPVVDTLEP